MGEYDGLSELLNADVDTEVENHRVIEGELSEYASFLYDVTTNEYYIESNELAEIEEYDDIKVLIDDFFGGLDIGECHVTKEDFEGFKEFILLLKSKGEI